MAAHRAGDGFDVAAPCCQIEGMGEIACFIKHRSYAQCLDTDVAMMRLAADKQAWDGRTLECSDEMPDDVLLEPHLLPDARRLLR